MASLSAYPFRNCSDVRRCQSTSSLDSGRSISTFTICPEVTSAATEAGIASVRSGFTCASNARAFIAVLPQERIVLILKPVLAHDLFPFLHEGIVFVPHTGHFQPGIILFGNVHVYKSWILPNSLFIAAAETPWHLLTPSRDPRVPPADP